MRRFARISVALVCVAVGSLSVSSMPASAGGSNWSFDREHYQPGDTVVAWASIAWEHNPDLGTPAEGPYHAYLVPFTNADVSGEPRTPVGDIVISLEPYDAGFARFGPHHAEIAFRVPALPPGQYDLVVANAAGTSIGDLMGGLLTIDAPVIRATPTFAG